MVVVVDSCSQQKYALVELLEVAHFVELGDFHEEVDGLGIVGRRGYMSDVEGVNDVVVRVFGVVSKEYGMEASYPCPIFSTRLWRTLGSILSAWNMLYWSKR